MKEYPQSIGGGADVFSQDAYVSEMHEEYLDENYFSIVGQINRHPRYNNKRIMDPQVKMYCDVNKIEHPPEWGLPKPNEEAAYISMSKYAKDLLWMGPQQVNSMNRAWEWTVRHFQPYMGNSVIRSQDEVIAKLDPTTSSGAPFNAKYPKKKELFAECEGICEYLEQQWELSAVDKWWTFLSTNSLKEEVRPADKILKNAIRTFTACSVEATVVGNRLFADMNEKMNASHLCTASAVGMSPYYGKWNQLYLKLKAFRHGFALDESQFDSSLRAYLMWGCAWFRWQMLAPEYQTCENLHRIKVFYRNLVNTLVITPTGVIIMKTTGNPSGSPNTINDNTLILYVLLAFAWIETCPTQTSYEEFEFNTAKVLVGDDNTWTVSDEAVEFYNARSVIEVWKGIGITTTTDCLDPRPAEELDFLSARTIFVQGQALPVYDRKKLLTTLLYAPKEHLTPATTMERAGALLTVGWTDIPFRKFCRELISWLLERYDLTMKDDIPWILAKTTVLSDLRLFQLFMGKNEVMYAQGFIRKTRKIIKPNKRQMNMSTVGNNKNKNSGRRQRAPRKPRAQRQGSATRKTGGNGQKKRGPRPSRQGGVFRSGQLAGRGRTQNFGGMGKEIVIDQDEFIGAVTVAGQPNFNVTSYSVNPGNSTTFPWLSTIAARFEKYQFERLDFYYKREVSEFATNGQVGKVMMSFDADAADGPPTTKTQIEATRPHVDGMPSENISLIIPRRELKRLTSGFYVRPGLLPGSADIKTYDVGNLHVATQGIVNNVEVGELHVAYRVKLFLPVLEGTTPPTNLSVSQFQVNSNQALTTTVATVILFDGTVMTNGCNIVNTSGSFVPPVGNYKVFVWANATDTSAEVLLVILEIRKNGTNVNTSGVQAGELTMPANGNMPISVFAFVTCNGTDAITVVATATGAAGTLGFRGNVMFEAA